MGSSFASAEVPDGIAAIYASPAAVGVEAVRADRQLGGYLFIRPVAVKHAVLVDPRLAASGRRGIGYIQRVAAEADDPALVAGVDARGGIRAVRRRGSDLVAAGCGIRGYLPLGDEGDIVVLVDGGPARSGLCGRGAEDAEEGENHERGERCGQGLQGKFAGISVFHYRKPPILFQQMMLGSLWDSAIYPEKLIQRLESSSICDKMALF